MTHHGNMIALCLMKRRQPRLIREKGKAHLVSLRIDCLVANPGEENPGIR